MLSPQKQDDVKLAIMYQDLSYRQGYTISLPSESLVTSRVVRFQKTSILVRGINACALIFLVSDSVGNNTFAMY